jgi:hypothetical protein
VLFPPEKRPVSTCIIVLALSMLVVWARHEIFWAQYQPPRIHVRWSESVIPSARAALESQHQLRDPQHDSGRTWSYLPGDASTAAIRGLVLDPAVEDTQKIDRQRFRLTEEGSFGPLEGPFWWLWAAALGVTAGVLAAWIGQDRWWRVGLRVSRAGFRLGRRVWAWVTKLGAAAYHMAASALTRGVPELRAEVLGFFRFFYAAFLGLALVNGRLDLEPGRVPDDGQLGWAWLGWLSSRADLMASLEYALFALLAVFAIGLWTRITYACIAAGMTVWILVWIESQHSNAHTWVVTLFMIVCLVPVPWEVAPSVDSAIQRRRGQSPTEGLRGALYGYAVWMPGLILGTVWASAAFAKIDNSGLMWILGGAVKYHWVVDGRQAAVDWGQWIAVHHWAAVLLSGCGVVFEAAFIVSVFIRPGRWRYLFISTGLSLLIGFYLFHALLWWTWWLAFLSFAVPWSVIFDALAARSGGWLRRAAPQAAPSVAGQSRGLGPVHVFLIVAVCLHAAFRVPAGFGRFESYSGTYASTAEFDRINPLEPLDRLWVGYGSPSAVEIDAERAAEAMGRLALGEVLPAHFVASLQALERSVPPAGRSPTRFTLTRQRVSFDWVNGRFNPPGAPVVIGTYDVESHTFVSGLGAAVPAGYPQSR